jgi:hypothetical protein
MTDPIIKGISKKVRFSEISLLITVALIKNPNSGGKPPIFIKDVIRINSSSGDFEIDADM